QRHSTTTTQEKLSCPVALLTTQNYLVAPTFFAPISTPSIAPSACEVAFPVSADEDGVCAVRKPAKPRLNTTATTMVPPTSIALVIRDLPFQRSRAQDFRSF